jgi:hypothetical protein
MHPIVGQIFSLLVEFDFSGQALFVHTEILLLGI